MEWMCFVFTADIISIFSIEFSTYKGSLGQAHQICNTKRVSTEGGRQGVLCFNSEPPLTCAQMDQSQ